MTSSWLEEAKKKKLQLRIVLPGSAAVPSQGEVLAVGPGRILDNGDLSEIPVKVGDIIVFGQYAGSNTIKVDGEELLILSESDLLGTVSK